MLCIANTELILSFHLFIRSFIHLLQKHYPAQGCEAGTRFEWDASLLWRSTHTHLFILTGLRTAFSVGLHFVQFYGKENAICKIGGHPSLSVL